MCPRLPAVRCEEEDGGQGCKTRDDAHHWQRRTVCQRADQPSSHPAEHRLHRTLECGRTAHAFAHGAERQRSVIRNNQADCGAQRKKEHREGERARVSACQLGVTPSVSM